MSTILVIDDDVNIGNLLDEALGLEGYQVLRAYSGTEALMILDKLRPDLILLDLMLPGISGEEVLEKIKGIPVIVKNIERLSWADSKSIQIRKHLLRSFKPDIMIKNHRDMFIL